MVFQSLSFFITVALALASTAQADGLQSGSAHRRAHKLLKRAAASESAPPPDGAQVVPVTTTYAIGDLFHQTPLVGYTTIVSSQTAPSSSSTASDLLGGLLSDALGLQPSTSSPSPVPTGVSSSSSASNSSSVASSTSTKALSSTKSGTSTMKSSASSESIPGEVKQTVTHTAIVGAPANTNAPTDVAPVAGAASLPTGARNILIALGACIVGIVVIWFIVRKTKFGKSRDRMKPEDWQPPTMEEHDRNFDPSLIRRQSAASSFHSGGGGTRDDMFAISDYGHSHSSTYPERDFTSGNGASAPIGVYADLARGESPTQSVYEQQYIPSSNHQQQAVAYDYRTDRHQF